MSYNRVILVGNLVADPELKTTPNGVNVTRFRIAVGRRFTRTGEQPQADFFDIVAWRQTAEFVTRFFTKGRAILVSGALQSRTWTDNNGIKHYAVEVVADEVAFVDKRPEGNQTVAATHATSSVPASSYLSDLAGYEDLADDDELPF